MESISVIKTSVDRAAGGRVNVLWVLRGKSILLIGILAVRNWGIHIPVHSYICGAGKSKDAAVSSNQERRVGFCVE
jgi:hypothetical protein